MSLKKHFLESVKDDDPCWGDYEMVGMKNKNGKEVPNCVPVSESNMNENIFLEAEHQGKKVTLNKPMRGDVKKYKVYVTHPSTGNVVKVNFGDKNMEIKRDDPDARKSFRARHKCDQKTFEKDRHTAGYWSCRFWSSNQTVSQLLSK